MLPQNQQYNEDFISPVVSDQLWYNFVVWECFDFSLLILELMLNKAEKYNCLKSPVVVYWSANWNQSLYQWTCELFIVRSLIWVMDLCGLRINDGSVFCRV